MITLNTKKLKDALKIIKAGMGDGKVLPITKYLNIITEDGKIKIVATNVKSWVEFKDEIDDVESSINVIVDGVKFIQLVNKTTTENIKIEPNDNYLAVKANGEYKIPIIDGEYPQYKFQEGEIQSVDIGELIDSINKVKPAIDFKHAYDVLQCIHIKDNFAVGSDSATILKTPIDLNGELLLTEENIKLINALKGIEKVEMDINYKNKDMKIMAGNYEIYSPNYNGQYEFPDLSGVYEIQETLTNVVEVETKLLTEAIDRAGIFMKDHSLDAVHINFRDGIINIESLKKEFSEDVILELWDHVDGQFTCSLDRLNRAVKPFKTKTTTFYHGSDLILGFRQEDLEGFIAKIIVK